MNPIDINLPGNPRNKRIRDVRSYLRVQGISPKGMEWRDTWEWAYECAQPGIWLRYRRLRWPLSSEIATFYVYLLIQKMADDPLVNLGSGSLEKMPESIRAKVSTRSIGQRQKRITNR